MPKYTIGLDFGTLSVRALLVNVQDGTAVCDTESVYPHAVMTDKLPDGTCLPAGYALQHPADYVSCMRQAVGKLIQGFDPADIIGLGVDFTADTFMPVDAALAPLCLKEAFASDPQAWVKLWKHHGAEAEARYIREKAVQAGKKWIDEQYGGLVFAEWMFPRLLETYRKSPAVWQAADKMIEAGDWITAMLTGSDKRSYSYAAYKAFYTEAGWPDNAFLESLEKGFSDGCLNKLRGELLLPGQCVGCLNAQGAALLGLREGTCVSVAATDALTPMPALGLTRPGDMILSIGTSTVQIVLASFRNPVPGMCGAVKDGIVPGSYGYEYGQSCVGDHFDWAVKNIVPPAYAEEARKQGRSVHEILTEKAAAQKPGENGLLALDWWNGTRSVLMDASLTGMILGMTLATRAEDIYRALIEATAYSARLILETHEKGAEKVRNIYACGGISRKNALLMQIYADVLGRNIAVADCVQTAAHGSAVFAAAACGRDRGGYDTVDEAAENMKCGIAKIYTPDPDNHRVYDRLYALYCRLHDLFGRDNRDIMQELNDIAQQ